MKHATIPYVSLKKKMTYLSVEFIVRKCSNVLSDKGKAGLESEFNMYQFENFEEFDLKIIAQTQCGIKYQIFYANEPKNM